MLEHPPSLLVSVPPPSAWRSPGHGSRRGPHLGLPQRTPQTRPVSKGALESPRVSWREESAALDQDLERNTERERPAGSVSPPALRGASTVWYSNRCVCCFGFYRFPPIRMQVPGGKGLCSLLRSSCSHPSWHSVGAQERSVAGGREAGRFAGFPLSDTTHPGRETSAVSLHRHGLRQRVAV